MTIEEEKIKVLEWLGYADRWGKKASYRHKTLDKKIVYVINYNPQDDDEATFAEWAEIEGNMTPEEAVKWGALVVKYNREEGYFKFIDRPDILWKALMEVIK